jgi:predicted ArsR family transcriptional regulator
VAVTRWQAVAALVEPARRSLYDYVRHQPQAVTREQAADALAISRTLTAFHLDKLVDVGLLRARYEAPADQPRGRGRAPKVYEPTAEGLTLNVPPRQYELIAEILADAIAASPGDARRSAERQATVVGQQIGAAAAIGHVSGADDEIGAACTALADLGFEPRPAPALDGEGVSRPAPGVVLGNCPFHALAVRAPELICGINHAFVSGLLAGLGTSQLRADLCPRPRGCCVRVVVPDQIG